MEASESLPAAKKLACMWIRLHQMQNNLRFFFPFYPLIYFRTLLLRLLCSYLRWLIGREPTAPQGCFPAAAITTRPRLWRSSRVPETLAVTTSGYPGSLPSTRRPTKIQIVPRASSQNVRLWQSRRPKYGTAVLSAVKFLLSPILMLFRHPLQIRARRHRHRHRHHVLTIPWWRLLMMLIAKVAPAVRPFRSLADAKEHV